MIDEMWCCDLIYVIHVGVDIMWVNNIVMHMINVVIWYVDKNKEDIDNDMKWDVMW